MGTDRIQYSSKTTVGDRFVLLQHAAGFVDPLFSRGIWRSQESVDAAVAVLSDSGPGGVIGIAADNAGEHTATALVATAQEHFGGLHGALVSVGGPPPGSVLGRTDEEWRGAFESVFLGALRIATTVAQVAEGKDRNWKYKGC